MEISIKCQGKIKKYTVEKFAYPILFIKKQGYLVEAG